MVEYRNNIFQINSITGEEQTYEQVNRKCIRIALELRKRGVQEGDVVLGCSPNSLDAVLPILSALYVGAIPATLDPSVTLRDTLHLLKMTKPKFVFVVENAVELVQTAVKQLGLKPQIVVMGSSERYLTLAAAFLNPHPGEDDFIPSIPDSINDTAMIWFTSGTTDRPKAICLSHKSILLGAALQWIDDIDCSTVLYYSSYYWHSANTLNSYIIMSGGKRIIAGNFDPEVVLKLIDKYKISLIFFAPTSAMRFTEENTKKFKSESLHEMRISGAMMIPVQLQKLMKYFPNTMLHIGYSQAETGGPVSRFSKRSGDLWKKKLNTCGLPAPNTRIKIADVETGKALPPYERGEIRVQSPTMFKGYYNSTSNGILDADGFIRTGDVGYYDEDNCIVFADRIQDIFKYQNSQIAPASVENLLYQHPAVLETVVVGIPHEKDGNHPMALVVLRPGMKATEEELLKLVNDNVIDRERLRAGLHIVKRLPKTTTGKLARNVVRDLAADNAVINRIIATGNRIQRIDNVLHGTRVDIPINNKGLGRTIFEKMKQYRDKILQVDPETGEHQSYENVNKKCIRLALALKSRGIQIGDIIVICLENSMESLVLTYAILYLNAIPITLDPHISLIDAVHLLNKISPKLIFAVENSIELIKNSLAQLEITPKIIVTGTHRTFGALIEYLKPHPEEQTFVPNCVEIYKQLLSSSAAVEQPDYQKLFASHTTPY
ncbi:long-chain-fatty-acid--coa ligase [Holotrichia oblita]|uniref:Long-chain-fatty-acid--coa ligase n=1 Tax=Holotrichia oblita TaxID=644536 RepID=A0ACB9TX60_HOLOL|nr:long-chain-fatty-acid--coa ligase [Holotrichia oblita]